MNNSIKLATVVVALAVVLSAVAVLDSTESDAATTDVSTADQLRQAVNGATDGDIIRLADDIELAASEYSNTTGMVPFATINDDVTLELNGHSISWNLEGFIPVNEDDEYTTLLIFSVSGAAVTINGDGVIEAEAGECNSYGINIIDNGSITVNGGTYTGAPTAIQVKTGMLTVNDGVFEQADTVASQAPTLAKYVVNCIDNDFKDGTAVIELRGGTYCYDFSSMPEGLDTSYVANGYSSNPGEDGKYTVEPSIPMQAAIGNTQYATLDEAIAAVPDGVQTTITIVNSFSQSSQITVPAGKDIILALNGNTITGTKMTSTMISVIGSLTVQNGTIDGQINPNVTVTVNASGIFTVGEGSTVTGGYLNTIQNSGILSIDGGTVNKTSRFSINNSGTLTMSSGSITGSSGITNSDGDVTIGGGTIDVDGTAVSTNSYGTGAVATTKITGGTINADGNGGDPIVNSNGTTTVTGGTFNFDPSGFVPDTHTAIDNGDGTYTVHGNLTVTFMHDGEVFETVTVAYGEILEEVPATPTAPDHYEYIWVDDDGNGIASEPVTSDLVFHSALTLEGIDADVWTEYGDDGTIYLVGGFDSPVDGVVLIDTEWRVDGGAVIESERIAVQEGSHDYRLYFWIEDADGVPGLASWVGTGIDSSSFVNVPDSETGNIETDNSTVVIKPDEGSQMVMIDTTVSFNTGGDTSGVESTITISGTVDNPLSDVVIESKPIAGDNPENVPDVFGISLDVTIRNVVDYSMTISIPVTAEPGDDIIGAVAYYYNEVTRYLEEVECRYNPDSGTVDIFTDHNTKYYVAVLTESAPVAPEVPTQPDVDDDPDIVLPPFIPDDDDVYVPPTIVVDQSSADDDESVKIAACAAAAVAAAIIALILVAEYRKK